MTILFTKEKYKQIKKSYEKLLLERKDAVSHLAKAREMGDLSENGYYRSSKTRLSTIDFNLRKLSGFIKHGSVINYANRGIVEIGCKVTLEIDNVLQEYQIVGKEESDPSNYRISNESPLGIILLGKKEGDNVVLEAPSGVANYKIIKIK